MFAFEWIFQTIYISNEVDHWNYSTQLVILLKTGHLGAGLRVNYPYLCPFGITPGWGSRVSLEFVRRRGRKFFGKSPRIAQVRPRGRLR